MQKNSENIDRPKRPEEIAASLPYFYFIILILFFGVLTRGVSFQLYNILRSTGEIIVSCDRVEPGMINCQCQDNPLLSWFQPTIKTYNYVTSASYKHEEYTDKDGKQHVTYNAILSAYDKDIVIFSFYDKYPIEDMTSEVNNFLQSKREHLTFKKTVKELSLSDVSFEVIIHIIFICVGTSFFMFFLRGLITKLYVILRSKKTHVS